MNKRYGTAREARTNSWVMFYAPLHMDISVLADQQELIYISSMWIQEVVWKTSWEHWTSQSRVHWLQKLWPLVRLQVLVFLFFSLVQEVFGLSSLPVVHCYTDNACLCETLWSTKVISDKGLRVDVARLWEMVSRNEIRVSLIEGGKQLADSLIKCRASTKKLLEVLQSFQI